MTSSTTAGKSSEATPHPCASTPLKASLLPSDIRNAIPSDCILLVASDLTSWLAETELQWELLDAFIDELKSLVHRGTLLFPTFNWDYCTGEAFDIGRTKSRTGALGAAALKRSDFERTQHPIYSFAVWGWHRAYLCGLRNTTAFGWDSPFAVIDKMLAINIPAQHSLSFAHHVEQVLGAPWRFEKDFGGYSQYVRKEGIDTDLRHFDKGRDGTFQLYDLPQVFHEAKKDILMGEGLITHEDPHRELRYYRDRLWYIMRSITGPGERETFNVLSEIAPLVQHAVPTGTQVFDWTVPKEWIYRSAKVIGPDNRVWLDADWNNLHLVNYSIPVDKKVTANELRQHLHTEWDSACVSRGLDDAIPYRTTYYKEDWGFCLSRNQLRQMKEGTYHVKIDTELIAGCLNYADLILPGETSKEVWFSTYTCHPSMANNELSGPLALAFLARKLSADKDKHRHYTYRFIFAPETIGIITYLATIQTKRPVGGYEVTCCGDRAPLQYKRSMDKVGDTDYVAEYVLQRDNLGVKIRDFFPHAGADERHYNSPGFGYPIGTIMRSAPGEYPEYHTSLDDRRFLSLEHLQGTIDTLYRIVQVWEMNRYFQATNCGEPMLGKRGLYKDPELVAAMRWLLSRPVYTLLDMAKDSGIPIERLYHAARVLEAHELVRELKG